MRKLTVVGMGPGSQSCLTLEALEALRKADLIVGAGRLLETLPEGCSKNRKIAVSAQAVCDAVYGSDSSFPCVVCTGDTGCYSLCTGLGKYWDGELSILPGIGSMSYLAAKLQLPWQDWKVVSAHGRACDPVAAVTENPEVFFLTGREKTADDIGNDTVSAKKNSENSVTGSYWRERAKTHGPGLLDDWFVRGEVPMTKQEVRAAALAKLGAAGAKVLYDVGAGTGSVSVELSLMAGQADVYAIECEEKAVELIGKNRERFGCGNLHVVFGKAPQALDSLPAPDAVFIGGTKGNLPEILSILFEKNPSVRIVVTAILLETALQACESLEAFTLKPAEIMQLQVSRSKKAGKGHMLCANNPIFLISAGGCADE